MKTQGWRYQVNQRRRRLQLDAGKISIARQVILLEVVSHVPPISSGLQSQVNMLRRFQFQDREAAAARDPKQIEDAVFTAGIGEDLCVNIARVKLHIDARDVFSNNRFQSALRLRAIERMPRIGSQRMPVDVKITQQLL